MVILNNCCIIYFINLNIFVKLKKYVDCWMRITVVSCKRLLNMWTNNNYHVPTQWEVAEKV